MAAAVPSQLLRLALCSHLAAIQVGGSEAAARPLLGGLIPAPFWSQAVSLQQDRQEAEPGKAPAPLSLGGSPQTDSHLLTVLTRLLQA